MLPLIIMGVKCMSRGWIPLGIWNEFRVLYICWCSLVRYFHTFKESPLLARLNKKASDEPALPSFWISSAPEDSRKRVRQHLQNRARGWEKDPDRLHLRYLRDTQHNTLAASCLLDRHQISGGRVPQPARKWEICLLLARLR